MALNYLQSLRIDPRKLCKLWDEGKTKLQIQSLRKIKVNVTNDHEPINELHQNKVKKIQLENIIVESLEKILAKGSKVGNQQNISLIEERLTNVEMMLARGSNFED